MTARPARLALAGAALALLASACTHAERSDRIAFSAGNAVRANLEGQTTNPSKRSMYVTSGLGRNGSVIPSEAPAP